MGLPKRRLVSQSFRSADCHPLFHAWGSFFIQDPPNEKRIPREENNSKGTKLQREAWENRSLLLFWGHTGQCLGPNLDSYADILCKQCSFQLTHSQPGFFFIERLGVAVCLKVNSSHMEFNLESKSICIPYSLSPLVFCDPPPPKAMMPNLFSLGYLLNPRSFPSQEFWSSLSSSSAYCLGSGTVN